MKRSDLKELKFIELLNELTEYSYDSGRYHEQGEEDLWNECEEYVKWVKEELLDRWEDSKYSS